MQEKISRKKSPEDDNSLADTDTLVTQVRKVSVDAERAGQRIDNFLRSELPGVPK